MYSPPQSIEHRGLAYCYTAYIYIYIGPPQSIKHRGLAYCYTAYKCHRHGKGITKETKRFGVLVVFGVLAWMLVDVQTNTGSSDVHVQWFSTGRSEQIIMTSFCDVTRISHAIEGGNYKMRAQLSLRAVVAVVWVFRYQTFGSTSKPQTLYLSCLGASLGISITRMDSVTCLSICMYPDLSGEHLVGVTSVV